MFFLKITQSGWWACQLLRLWQFILEQKGEVVADNAASAPVAEATAQWSAECKKFQKLTACAPTAAEKAPLADNEYDIIVDKLVVLLVTILPFVEDNLVVRLLSLEEIRLGGTSWIKDVFQQTYLKIPEIMMGLRLLQVVVST